VDEEKGMEKGMQMRRRFLTIFAHKKRILGRIASSPLTVIHGETGCGKSSQVPQFILDQHLEQGGLTGQAGGQKPFIVVTQPRRIAAITLARRVAQERGTVCGEEGTGEVGYMIGKEKSTTSHTRLVFATAGWLLQKLIFNPHYMRRMTHCILDEIHERSVDADLLSVVIKRLLARLPAAARPKLIVMSGLISHLFHLEMEI